MLFRRETRHLFFSGGSATEICVSSSMRLTENAHEWIADLSDSASLAPLLRLFGRRVKVSNAFKNGLCAWSLKMAHY